MEGVQTIGAKTSGYYGLGRLHQSGGGLGRIPALRTRLRYELRGGGGGLRGQSSWSLDAQVIKDIGIWKERVGAQFFWLVTNVPNHMQAGSPSLSLSSPTTFGQESGGGSPRSMEFGLRIHF